MKIIWMPAARADLVRLHNFHAPVAPDAAAKALQSLVRAPQRLLDFPRIGEKLDVFLPREVRCIFVGKYEMRYEVARETIFILRLWHTRENRSGTSD